MCLFLFSVGMGLGGCGGLWGQPPPFWGVNGDEIEENGAGEVGGSAPRAWREMIDREGGWGLWVQLTPTGVK